MQESTYLFVPGHLCQLNIHDMFVCMVCWINPFSSSSATVLPVLFCDYKPRLNVVTHSLFKTFTCIHQCDTNNTNTQLTIVHYGHQTHASTHPSRHHYHSLLIRCKCGHHHHWRIQAGHRYWNPHCGVGGASSCIEKTFIRGHKRNIVQVHQERQNGHGGLRNRWVGEGKHRMLGHINKEALHLFCTRTFCDPYNLVLRFFLGSSAGIWVGVAATL